MYRVKTGVLGSLVALAIGCGGLESRVESFPEVAVEVQQDELFGQLRFQRSTYTLKGQYHDDMTFFVEFYALDGNSKRQTDNFMKSTLVHAQFKRGHMHWYTDYFGRLTRISKKYRSEYKHREIHKPSDAYTSFELGVN